LLLAPVNPPHLLSAAEACVREAFPGADARVRRTEPRPDGGDRDQRTNGHRMSPGSVVAAIPMRPGGPVQYVLELIPGRRALDDWDRQAIDTASRLVGLALEIARLRGVWPGRSVAAEHPVARPRLIGVSDSIRRLRETIARVAPTDSTVVLQGESGT